MRRGLGVVAVIFIVQSVAGCAWVDRDPIRMKVAASAPEAAPCLAAALGKEFQDPAPVIDTGATLGGRTITVNAPRGGLLAFVTVDPLPDGGSDVAIYNGDLYWPKTQVSGVFPDVARDNWHRAEAAVRECQKPAA